MVKVEHISTPSKTTTQTCNNNNNNTSITSPTSSSSSSSDQSSPTSPLPPPTEITIMPPVLLPHHHYPSQSSIILYTPPPPPQHPPMVYYQYYPHPSYFYPPTFYHPPPPPQQQQQQQQPEQPVFYYQEVTPPPNPYPQTIPPVSGLMNPIIRGPRANNQVYGFGFRSGSRSWRKRGYGLKPKKDQNPVKYCYNGGDQGNNVGVQKVWKPKVKIMEETNKVEENPNSSPNISYPPELANCTTIMVKNIPNSLRRNKLMELLDRHCREQNEKNDKDGVDSCQSQYNFVYLPFDFVHEQNLGYAFVNFTTTEAALTLYTRWNNKGWNLSPKICNITPAKYQGLAQCRRNFQDSMFMCKSEEYLPVEFTPARNGFNGDTCKAKTIGNWVNASHPRKTSGKKGLWAKIIHPPKLN